MRKMECLSVFELATEYKTKEREKGNPGSDQSHTHTHTHTLLSVGRKERGKNKQRENSSDKALLNHTRLPRPSLLPPPFQKRKTDCHGPGCLEMNNEHTLVNCERNGWRRREADG